MIDRALIKKAIECMPEGLSISEMMALSLFTTKEEIEKNPKFRKRHDALLAELEEANL